MVWRTLVTSITTCFLLGTTFTHWIADHNVLWRSPLTPAALEESIKYYALIGSGHPALAWAYLGVGLASIAAAAAKMVSGWRGQSGEVLFDGACLLLIASITYNQVTEVYPRAIMAIPAPLPENLTDHEMFPTLATAVRDLANDNIITAVMLTGIMLLQGGRYYSSRTSRDGPEFMPTVSGETSVDTSANVSPASTPRPLSERHATPFRELTEEEAMELKGSDDERGRRGVRRR